MRFEQITSSEDPDQIAEDIHGQTLAMPTESAYESMAPLHSKSPMDGSPSSILGSNNTTAMVALAMLLSVLLVFYIFFMALH